MPFTNNTAFKSALFTPVKLPPLKTLTLAVERYENLTGETVDVDRNAIADALKRFVAEELKQVIPVQAQAKAHRLPVVELIEGYGESLAAIQAGSPDDCVNTLVGSGTSLKKAHDCIRKIVECLDDAGLAALRSARTAVEQMWPQLETRGHTELAPKAAEVTSLLDAENFYESLGKIKVSAGEIQAAYAGLYAKAHADRAGQFDQAIEKIKGRPEWSDVAENMREPVLSPLSSRCCGENDWPEAGLVCRSCKATLSQMESDVAALGGLFAQVVAQIQKLTTPPEVKLQRVRIADFFGGAMDSEDQIKQAVARLQDHLLKLLDEGVRIVVE